MKHPYLCGALFVALTHCGSVVGAPAEPSGAAVAVGSTAPMMTCAAVRASCGTAPQHFFRAFATGLTGVDGNVAQVAVRYLLERGVGLRSAHGVVLGRSVVRDGAFEACMCVPQNANVYPQVAAVVFANGVSEQTAASVERAYFSQRYAVVGDEELSMELQRTPRAIEREVALAAMSERFAETTVQGIPAEFSGMTVYGGLVSEERSMAAELSGAQVTNGSAQMLWTMPGRSSATEQLVWVVDVNRNRQCDENDVGARQAFAPMVSAVQLRRGTDVLPLCAALQVALGR